MRGSRRTAVAERGEARRMMQRNVGPVNSVESTASVTRAANACSDSSHLSRRIVAATISMSPLH